ncbi:MAG: hypothetical protein WCK67_03180 [bacterium]
MKGCFFSIIKLIFSIAIGFFAVLFFVFGGFDYVKGLFSPNQYINNSTEMNKAMKIADFSKISKDFQIVKTVDMIGANAVIANYKPTGQKIGFINTGLLLNLTKNDLKSATIEQQLTNIGKSYENNVIKLEKLAVTHKGSFNGLNQQIPYVKVAMKVKLPAGLDLSQNTEGIIGIATSPKGQNNIILAINKYGQYNQAITEKFTHELKYNK